MYLEEFVYAQEVPVHVMVNHRKRKGTASATAVQAFVYCGKTLVKILITGQHPQHLAQAKFLYAWPDTHVQRDSCGSIWGTICVSGACAYVCACQHTLIFNLVDSLVNTFMKTNKFYINYSCQVHTCGATVSYSTKVS